MESRFNNAILLFDEANAKDPNMENYNGKNFPKELLYSMRMTEKLSHFNPDVTEAVKLAARCQHICRWEIPRDSYEMNRNGYLQWRRDLTIFHAEKASGILRKVGYDEEIIERVASLLQKKKLKKDPEMQDLEDVICLVFLENYFEKFSKKYTEDKLIDILTKTWTKMSDKGHNYALKLNLSSHSKALINKVLV